MAEGFRFDIKKNSPEIAAPKRVGGSEFEDWTSSPNFPTHQEVSLLRGALRDHHETPTRRVTTEDLDGGEIIASLEEEEEKQGQELPPPQEIAFPRQGEICKNFFREVQHDAGLEPLIVPPVCAVPNPGSSISKVTPVTEIATDASAEFLDPNESPESISRLSRIESAKQDMKNLKSATLGRMGRMFKTRPPTPADREKSPNPSEERAEAAASVEQQFGQDPTRKEKTHSLGRMLRLVDKDGAPRKLFSHTRAGSLTRLRKLHSTVGNATGSSEESRNIFSRMISQFRGRNQSGTNAEPNLQSINGAENSPKPSLGTRLMMSLSARGNSSGGTTGVETPVERVAV